jgi:hypothetical protein
MLSTEWTFAKDWISYRVSKWKWLVVHQLDNVRLNDWPDEDKSDSDEEEIGTE